MSKKKDSGPVEPYIDPNSGAAPQPGGFAHAHGVLDEDGPTDAAVDTSTLNEDEEKDEEGDEPKTSEKPAAKK